MFVLFSRLIHRLLARHHFWRHVDFPELAELYAARILRSTAVSLVTIFVAIYMYQNDYSVIYITLFFAGYFVYRALLALPMAYVVGHIGPKHGTLYSNLLYVPALIALAALPDMGLTALLIYAFFQGLSMTLFMVSYLVDFSKVRHSDHVGKEIGFMQIMDRLGTTLSPLLGGLLAYLFGPQVTIFVAVFIFAIAALPLFFTPEPVQVKQRVSLRGGLNLHTVRGAMSFIGVGVDHGASIFLWPLFLVLAVFTSGTDIVYAQIGLMASVAVIAALVAAKVYGMLIDRARGRQLLEVSVFLNSGLHLSRLFVASPVGVVAFNIANEIATAGYHMPYAKGVLDTADQSEENRVGYVAFSEVFSCLGVVVIMVIAAAFVHVLGDVDGLRAQYVAAATLTLLILAHGFRVYRNNPLVPNFLK